MNDTKKILEQSYEQRLSVYESLPQLGSDDLVGSSTIERAIDFALECAEKSVESVLNQKQD